MQKFVPFEKLSKKEKRKLNSTKRGSWNGLDPATKIADTDRKKYRRKPKYPEKYDQGSGA